MKILGKLEQKVMDVVWSSKEPVKPSQVQTQLGTDHAYTTIMTVMKRLSDKKILTRFKCGNHYCYKAASKKESFAKKKLNELFDSVFSSYGEVAITQFVDTVKDDKQSMQKLKQYLDNLDD